MLVILPVGAVAVQRAETLKSCRSPLPCSSSSSPQSNPPTRDQCAIGRHSRRKGSRGCRNLCVRVASSRSVLKVVWKMPSNVVEPTERPLPKPFGHRPRHVDLISISSPTHERVSISRARKNLLASARNGGDAFACFGSPVQK